MDRARFVVNYALPLGTPLVETNRVGGLIMRDIASISEVDSYARDSSMANISIAGEDGFVYNSRTYSDQNLGMDLGTDYHFGTKNLHNGGASRWTPICARSRML